MRKCVFQSKRMMRIIAFLIAQAIICGDFLWAAQGVPRLAREDCLSPQIEMRTETILNVFRQGVIPSAVRVENQENVTDPSRGVSRRFFLKAAAVCAVAGAATMLFPEETFAQPNVIDKPKDLIIENVPRDVIGTYIEALGSDEYLKNHVFFLPGGNILLRVGQSEADAAHLQQMLNEKLPRGYPQFKLASSSAAWEETKPYKILKGMVDEFAGIASDRGDFIDKQKLMHVLEAMTFRESRFEHRVRTKAGKIALNTSGTGAIGMLQLIPDESVADIARFYYEHLGGAQRINEIVEIINGYTGLIEKAKLIEGSASPENSVLNLVSAIDQEKNLIGVNIFFALAVWVKSGLLDAESAKYITAAAENIRKRAREGKDYEKLLKIEPEGFKPASYREAQLLYDKQMMLAKIILTMVRKVVSKETLERIERETAQLKGIDALKARTEALTKELKYEVEDDVNNQIVGYTYFFLCYDLARRLRLDRSDLREVIPAEIKSDIRGFDPLLVAAAMYNGGISEKGPVQTALRTFGRNWYLNIIGVRRTVNPREPINYVGQTLDYVNQLGGKLSDSDYEIMRKIIAERYKRLRVIKGDDGFFLHDFRAGDIVNGKTAYKQYSTNGSFDAEAMTLLAIILGSDVVDSYIMGWVNQEKKIILDRSTSDFVLERLLRSKHVDSIIKAMDTGRKFGRDLVAFLEKRGKNKSGDSAYAKMAKNLLEKHETKIKLAGIRQEIHSGDGELEKLKQEIHAQASVSSPPVKSSVDSVMEIGKIIGGLGIALGVGLIIIRWFRNTRKELGKNNWRSRRIPREAVGASAGHHVLQKVRRLDKKSLRSNARTLENQSGIWEISRQKAILFHHADIESSI